MSPNGDAPTKVTARRNRGFARGGYAGGMTLALTAKITVAAAALHADPKVHELAHDFLVARLEAARAVGAQAWAYPLTTR